MNQFNPFKFDGRIGRLQYFGFGAIWGVIIWVMALGMGLGAGASGEVGAGMTATMLGLAAVIAIATVSYGVRRLHDFDKSGWWYLLMFVPGASVVMALVLLLAPETQGANRFGSRV